MATKLYTNRDWYMDWLTSSLTLKGGWAVLGTTTTPTRGHFSPVKENNSTGIFSVRSATTAPYRAPMHLGVSPRLQAQTISGTINPLVYTSEGNAAYNCYLRCHVWVTVGDTDVVRATLLNQFEDTTNEFALSRTAQRFSTAQALTPAAVLDGDRLVIELGCVQTVAGAGTFDIGALAGSRYTKADATVGATDTTLNQYVEFSADLLFKPGLPNDHCSGATAVSTFPHTETIDTTNSATVNQPNQSGSCSSWGDDSIPVWWTLTPPAGATLTIHTGGSAYPTVVSLYTGSCAALSEIGCANSPTAASPLTFGPTSGATYYLLVNRDVYADGENDITGPGGIVSLSVTAGAAAPPGCTTAIVVTTIPTTITNLDTTSAADDTSPVISCAELQKRLQWFQYTPATSHRLYVSAQGIDYDHVLALYTGSCPFGPWTEIVCRRGAVATPAKISWPVTAGTTYWIVVAADDWDPDNPNTGGSLDLFFGDSVALGFIHPGQGGATEWDGSYAYHACNGNPCFLNFLQKGSGGSLVTLRLYEAGACTVGGYWVIDVGRLVVVAQSLGSPLPGIPLTTFPLPAPCGDIDPTPLYGHRNYAQSPPSTDFSLGYVGSFGLRFRLSSWDEAGGPPLPDGYIEVRWPGSTFGTYRYDNLVWSGGAGWEGFQFSPGWWTNKIYIRDIDEFCDFDPTASHLVWFRDFTETPATPAELFTESGGLYNRTLHFACSELNPALPLPAAPRIDDLGRPTYIGIYTPQPPDPPGPPFESSTCFAALRHPTAFPPFVPPEPPDGCVTGGFPIDPDD